MNLFVPAMRIAQRLCIVLTGVCLFWAGPAFGRILLEPEVSTPTFRALIQNGTIKSPDDLMGILPLSMRTNHFGLAHGSRSPMKRWISPAAPRIIALTSDIAFALSPTPDDLGKVYAEYREVDRTTMKFIPRMIEFDMVRGGVPLLVEDPVAYYKNNPSRNCVTCHGVDHHDIWDPYKYWAGFFSQIHQRFPPADIARGERYLRTLVDAPVYRHLKFPGVDIKEQLLNLSHSQSRMTNVMAKLNSARIIARIMASPRFPRYRAAILASLLGMDIMSYLSHEDLELYQARHPELLAYTRRQINGFFASLMARLSSFGVPSEVKYETNLDEKEAPVWANIKFICERMDVPTEHWWSTVERDSFIGSNGQYGLPHEIRRQYIEKLIEQGDEDLFKGALPEQYTISIAQEWYVAAEKLRDKIRLEGPACDVHLTHKPNQLNSR